MGKYAVILHASPGTHDGMGRAAHALLYAKELNEAGIGVKLIFDGGGTAWLREFQKTDNPLRPLYEAVKATGVIAGVCKYCIGVFGGKPEDATKEGLELDGGYQDHPSLAALIKEGYQIITL
jgi:predicted peroxiredoxin